MPRTYERLSTQDRSFLIFEDEAKHMHLGGLTLFEPGSLAAADGSLDVERIRAHIASRIHLVPRYRQRLAWIPLRGRPVWVDDQHFDLTYHVRHTAVPRPGGDEQLKDLVARIMSQQLDRGKPLWEIWAIEGLTGGRFAMLVKTHHALADGISAFNLFAALLSPAPTEVVDPPQPWEPRPTPSGLELLGDDLFEQATAPLRLARDVSQALRNPDAVRERALEAARAIWDIARAGLAPVAQTPLNRPVGPHRRFDWLMLDLETVLAVRRRLGGTVNDVVLSTVAGAVRQLLQAAGAAVEDVEYRVIVPVSVRGEGELGVINNRASGWLMPLPVGIPTALERHAAVRAATERLKSVRQELAPDVLGRLVEYVAPGALTLGVRLTELLTPYNLIVTNVAGPPLPLYMLSARLLAGFPQVPLFSNQSLGVALFSYAGRLCWGFTADWDAGVELASLVGAVHSSFDALCAAAEVPAARSAAAS